MVNSNPIIFFFFLEGRGGGSGGGVGHVKWAASVFLSKLNNVINTFHSTALLITHCCLPFSNDIRVNGLCVLLDSCKLQYIKADLCTLSHWIHVTLYNIFSLQPSIFIFMLAISCTAAVTTFSSIIRPTCRYVHSNVSQDVSESCTIYREEDEQERRSCYFQHLQSFQKFFPASDSKKKRKKNSLSLLFNIDGWKLVSLAEWNTERQFRSPSFWVTAETRSERQWQRRGWGKTRF